MGCDIHWILEQRHPDGSWHAVASNARAYEIFDANAPSWTQPEARFASQDRDPAMRLGQRHYGLFGWLSGVRCPPLSQGPLARSGFPEDASDYARAEASRWDPDWHSHGHLLPEDLPAIKDSPIVFPRLVQNRSQSLPPELIRWIQDLLFLAAAHDGAPVLLPPILDTDSGTWIHPQAENAPRGLRASAHIRLAAAARGLEAKGGPWRLLIAYDN